MDNIIRNFQNVFVTMRQVNKGYSIQTKKWEGCLCRNEIKIF